MGSFILDSELWALYWSHEAEKYDKFVFAHSHYARKYLSSSVEMLKDRAFQLVDNLRNAENR